MEILYRAVDRAGDTVDFLLHAKREVLGAIISSSNWPCKSGTGHLASDLISAAKEGAIANELHAVSDPPVWEVIPLSLVERTAVVPKSNRIFLPTEPTLKGWLFNVSK